MREVRGIDRGLGNRTAGNRQEFLWPSCIFTSTALDTNSQLLMSAGIVSVEPSAGFMLGGGKRRCGMMTSAGGMRDA